ncbi:MAG: hypothetical protein GF365_02145 [Candidatus Buchananbacteria bacterium]|nr:hypothetical protein [Candidatus Buchananbacteria bacterium]
MKKIFMLGIGFICLLGLVACDGSGSSGGSDSDGGGNVNSPTNNAPVINSTPITTAVSQEGYLYDMNAADIDGDTLIYGLAVSPSGMNINTSSGLINWTPIDSQIGDHSVKVSVTDGQTTVYQEYTLTVNAPPPNTAPIFSSIPVTTATVNVLYSYDLNATDFDGDSLTYSLINWPSGMVINNTTGLISWTPDTTQVGNHWLEVATSDGETTTSQLFTIRVNPSHNGIPFQRGCVLTSWWYTDWQSTTVENTLLQMKDDGCERIALVITWYQDSLTATTIYDGDTKTPSDTGITHVTNYAHSLGLDVYFKPHVDIWQRSDLWRGDITFANEADWTAWFASYNSFISYYLDLAEALNVEGFVIGVELVGTEHRETDWRDTVAIGRSKFTGLITYNANHDSYLNVTWWDVVDFIGISGYFPLTSSYTQTQAQLNAAWSGWLTELSNFATTWNMDIVFMEIGYQSYNGTNISPWWAPTSTTDYQEQADCYEAAFNNLLHQPWFKGMYWWMWYWDPVQDVDGFDIFQKPAELTMRWWYAGY